MIWNNISKSYQRCNLLSIFAPIQFSNCTHGNEVGYKIVEVLATGTLSEDRWKNYIKLKKKQSI